MRFVPVMDTTGLVALEDIYQDLKRHGCSLRLTGLQPEVEELLDRTGLLDKIGRENCYLTTEKAIEVLVPPNQEADPESVLTVLTKTGKTN